MDGWILQLEDECMLCRPTSHYGCWLHMQLKHEASKSAMHRENERVMDATCGCMQLSLHNLAMAVFCCLPLGACQMHSRTKLGRVSSHVVTVS